MKSSWNLQFCISGTFILLSGLFFAWGFMRDQGKFDIGNAPPFNEKEHFARADRLATTETLSRRDGNTPHDLNRYDPDGSVWRFDFTNQCWVFLRHWNPTNGNIVR